ncbi:MAG: hypothetical protein KH703_01325 [Campylobacter gracilis]|uniref:hypothetical protein n=1 Tax=Campylobacter gracilis TaxID=824 RepID=UPI0026EB44C2|nr:hypothetical protein [Campylobacter gracilis]MBS6152054.1 hypothetical protein [Campylobacter gracilis]
MIEFSGVKFHFGKKFKLVEFCSVKFHSPWNFKICAILPVVKFHRLKFYFGAEFCVT